jgi:hypothetical protein
MNDARNLIDQVVSNLTVSITEPGTITVLSQFVGDTNVDAATFLQLDLVPSARYSPGNGGYIEIVCP